MTKPALLLLALCGLGDDSFEVRQAAERYLAASGYDAVLLNRLAPSLGVGLQTRKTLARLERRYYAPLHKGPLPPLVVLCSPPPIGWVAFEDRGNKRVSFWMHFYHKGLPRSAPPRDYDYKRFLIDLDDAERYHNIPRFHLRRFPLSWRVYGFFVRRTLARVGPLDGPRFFFVYGGWNYLEVQRDVTRTLLLDARRLGVPRPLLSTLLYLARVRERSIQERSLPP